MIIIDLKVSFAKTLQIPIGVRAFFIVSNDL